MMTKLFWVGLTAAVVLALIAVAYHPTVRTETVATSTSTDAGGVVGSQLPGATPSTLRPAVTDTRPGTDSSTPSPVIAVIDSGGNHQTVIGSASFIGEDPLAATHQHGPDMRAVAASQCPQCRFLVAQVVTPDGQAKWADTAPAIEWAVDNNADVILISIAGAEPSTDLEAATSYAHQAGVTVVAAAGNVPGILYPAGFNTVVSVSIVDGIADTHGPACHEQSSSCGSSVAAAFVAGRVADGQAIQDITHPFDDVPDEAWFADAVQWAVDNDITSGTSATTFSPDKPVTRAEMVTFLCRMDGSC